jgi:protein-tyrosine phosphatase
MAAATACPTFRLLFVCTGNICRSPFAEMFTRHAFELTATERNPFEVASAGVAAVIGSAMHPASCAALEYFGIPETAAARFRACQLTASHVAAADLVLGAAPIHRGEALRVWPQAIARAFTLREFARLVRLVDLEALPADPVGRARALVEATRAARGMTPPVSPEANTVPDPMGGSAADHLNSARIAADALRVALATLTPDVGAALRCSAAFVTD